MRARRQYLGLFVAAAVFSALPGALMAAPQGSAQQANSCQSWFDTCAARCKARAPNDTNCVADHCTPKLNECRANGCWREGEMYGDKRHCNLAR